MHFSCVPTASHENNMKTRETITPTLDTKKVCVCVCVCQDIPLKVHRDSTENHSEVKRGHRVEGGGRNLEPVSECPMMYYYSLDFLFHFCDISSQIVILIKGAFDYYICS